MSNKYENCEMIKAIAEDKSLVVFIKHNNHDSWCTLKYHGFPDLTGSHKYFLCLPQHKDVCLHWLNGGESQLEYTHQSYPTWNSIDNDAKDWSMGHVFMDGSLKIRIKPKKTKRWIGVFKEGGLLKNTELSYKTKEQLKGSAHAPNGFDGWQFIEIEVEV